MERGVCIKNKPRHKIIERKSTLMGIEITQAVRQLEIIGAYIKQMRRDIIKIIING